MKKLLLFVFIAHLSYTMQQPAGMIPRTTAINEYRQKNKDTYYPDITLSTEQDWQKASFCFNELLKLDFYPRAKKTNQCPKVTFADAKRYCEYKTMYRNMHEFQSSFVVDDAIIKRLTNLIMFGTFYPDGSGSSDYGPPPGTEELAIFLTYEKVWRNPASLRAVLNEPLDSDDQIYYRFEEILVALENFKIKLPQRNKLENR